MKGFHLGATLVLALVFASLIWYAVCFNSYVERMTAVPLGLSKNYCEVTVFYDGLTPGTNEQKAEFMARLLALIENKEVTIVASMQSLAIGLYDGQGTYSSCLMTSGQPLDPGAFQQNNLLINADSHAYTEIGSDMIYLWGGTEFEVVGIYDSSHPLSAISGAEYICSLFHQRLIRDSTLAGRYRIDTPDKNLRDEIVAFFEESGCHFSYYTSFNKSLWTLFKEYFFGVGNLLGHIRILWLAIVTYFSCFTLLYNIICTQKKFAATSLHFGATRFDLFFTFGKRMLLNLCLGTIAGLGIYLLLTNYRPTVQLVVVAALINLVLTSLTYAIAFSLVKFEIIEGEKA